MIDSKRANEGGYIAYRDGKLTVIGATFHRAHFNIPPDASDVRFENCAFYDCTGRIGPVKLSRGETSVGATALGEEPSDD